MGKSKPNDLQDSSAEYGRDIFWRQSRGRLFLSFRRRICLAKFLFSCRRLNGWFLGRLTCSCFSSCRYCLILNSIFAGVHEVLSLTCGSYLPRHRRIDSLARAHLPKRILPGMYNIHGLSLNVFLFS